MTITARVLVEDALQDCGVLDPVETMTAEQADHGLRTLNRIIDSWRANRLFVFAVTDVSATFSGATATVGASLTVNTDAPIRFLPGCYYVRDGESFPLVEWTAEQYSAVLTKAASGDPEAFYFDRKIPGTVTVWPVPATAPTYHFMVMSKLSAFADLDTAYSLPDGYQEALHYSLCERLPTAYSMQVDPANAAHARRAVAVIRRNNVRVPILDAVDKSSHPNIINGG
jgi:hypothetical protein